MRRAIDRTPAWLFGAVALVLVVLATFLAFGGKLPWQKDYELKAMVNSGLDLSSRSPVRIAGVEVGKVKKIERGPGNTAIITMTIKDVGLPIHKDATLKVRPRIFLEGNFFVDLRPGTPDSPTVGSGYTIPVAQTSVPVQFDEILSTLHKPTRRELVSFVDQLSVSLDGGGGDALSRTFTQMGPAFMNIAIASQAARGTRDDDISSFIRGAEKTARAIASRDAQLVTLIDGLERTVTALASRSGQLEASLPQLDALVAEAPAALRAVDDSLPAARALAIEARPALREAPTTLRLAKPVLAQARALVAPGELPALLDELNPSLDELRPLEPRLTTLLGGLSPVLDCLHDNAIPTLKSSIVDPPHTTGVPIYRELLHTNVGLASASQNFDGNGAAVRYHAGFGDQLVTTGSVPSVGEPLVGTTSEPLIGSRPKKPAQQPPFRSDIACNTQEPPNLAAATGPAPQQRKVKLKAAP